MGSKKKTVAAALKTQSGGIFYSDCSAYSEPVTFVSCLRGVEAAASGLSATSV